MTRLEQGRDDVKGGFEWIESVENVVDKEFCCVGTLPGITAEHCPQFNPSAPDKIKFGYSRLTDDVFQWSGVLAK